MSPPPEARQRGSVADLAEECLRDFWVQTADGSSVEEAVAEASRAIDSATAILRRWSDPEPEAHSDSAATQALIWLNALLFHYLLAQYLDPNSLPEQHRRQRIREPHTGQLPILLERQWRGLLKINWWPIFSVALELLEQTPQRAAAEALEQLMAAARNIAARGAIRHHDIAGRILHRLLDSRKFLATNYTTIPAAALLGGLAFDPRHPRWRGFPWGRSRAIAKLRIVDPACGSGTLLMAVVQEILKLHRRSQARGASDRQVVRALLEQTLHGFDVVPAAVHLTAATLLMAETGQAITEMPIFWMPHDCRHDRPRLGSLDFLQASPGKGTAQFLQLFPEQHFDPGRTSGTGERIHDAAMPSNCDLVIANPPYTRAGGPGSSANTSWNPLFGSVLSQTDAELMKEALRKTLDKTPASLYAGLGSAFLVLAHERVAPGRRLAFVLPATALTGSRWAPLRRLLLDHYQIDWVVVSHDPRHRPAKAGPPGRLYVGFSESTRIAEVLVIATRLDRNASAAGHIRFVNLRRTPDEPIESFGLTRALLAAEPPSIPTAATEILVGRAVWGELRFVLQAELDESPWTQTAFVQNRLAEAASTLLGDGMLRLGRSEAAVPLSPVQDLCRLGPYEMQIKNPTQGLFDIVETDDPTRAGHPALWHHSARRILTLGTQPNARLQPRRGRDPDQQSAMLARGAGCK